MTKQQKEVTQLKREIRKLERTNRLLETKVHDSESATRYWQREYNRLLSDMQTNFHNHEKS